MLGPRAVPLGLLSTEPCLAKVVFLPRKLHVLVERCLLRFSLSLRGLAPLEGGGPNGYWLLGM